MITKLLFTIGLIIAVWRGFKLFETFRAKIADDDDEVPARPAKRRRRQAADEVELIACPRCGAFTPKGQFCTCDKPA